jgi:hypothetical protein
MLGRANSTCLGVTVFYLAMQGLVGQTKNRCGGRYALSCTNQSNRFKLKFQRVPRPACLFHNTSHQQDYASRYGIRFPGVRSLTATGIEYTP